MRKYGAYAGLKVRALLLARGLREVDLAGAAQSRRGFFAKFVSRLIHGKEPAAAGDPKIRFLAARLGVPPRFLADDALWPEGGSRFGLTAREAQTVAWIRSLGEWYMRHAGAEAAHKYLGLDFDALRRQSRLLHGLARAAGGEALIREFAGADYEDGRFDREFARLERRAERSGSARRAIVDYVADLPPDARRPGRRFPPLEIDGLSVELSFGEIFSPDRADVRYLARGKPGEREVVVHAGLADDARLAFILAREWAIHAGEREGILPGGPYEAHHWPCAIDSYARHKAEMLVNRFAAALLLPRRAVEARARGLLLGFSHDAVEAACREEGCGAETLLLRIVQLRPREAHFIRIDAPGPGGPYTIEKLFRGNGLPVHHPFTARAAFPPTWGVMKSLSRFFAAPPGDASRASRHVQLTRMARCGGGLYVCMSLAYPRFGGGAKVLCIGFQRRQFERLFGGLPPLSERRPAVDELSYDVDWKALVELADQSRRRNRSASGGRPRPDVGSSGVC